MTLTLWGNAQMENDGVSNIVTFEPLAAPRYALRKQGELVSHFEFLVAQALRDECRTVATPTVHYASPTLLDPFAEWWGQ